MLLAVLVSLSALQLLGVGVGVGVGAYPALLPFIYSPRHGSEAAKRSHISTHQIDYDVAELEQLRGMTVNDDAGLSAYKRQEDSVGLDAIVVPQMPTMVAPTSEAVPLTPTSETPPLVVAEIPGSKPRPPFDASSQPMNTKPFHGAARLAFGQNPELVPSSSTITTTTMATLATVATSAAVSQSTTSGAASADVLQSHQDDIIKAASAVGFEDDSSRNSTESETPPVQAEDRLGKEVYEEQPPSNSDAEKTNERRSAFHGPPKTADSLLRNPSGQYSAFDMAQYVFWTGDEAGVARAVEELIDEDLITKENALKFLRDIRLGIEFLQRSYDNRIIPSKLRDNQLKRKEPSTTTTRKPSTTTTTTAKPAETLTPYTSKGQEDDSFKSKSSGFRLEETLRRLAAANKASQLVHKDDDNQVLREPIKSKDVNENENSLYNEYTLEEILYRLAKTMFVEAVVHGTDEAQQELQKLMQFLEREANLGLIPAKLKNRVLKILLSAFADALNEHPEMLAAATANNAHPYYGLPLHIPNQTID